MATDHCGTLKDVSMTKLDLIVTPFFVQRLLALFRCRCSLLLLPLLAGCLATPASVQFLDSATISDVRVWSGTVQIRGVVTVTKTGHLTILPGTRIVFDKIDVDGDGIGDSELLVEGSLVAKGTPTAPILFTSGAATPAKGDWKYLYLDFARQAEVAHIISEYAYSGIQVHFCRAEVVDSEFRHNIDGVRFSTVNIEVRGNRIHNNTNGLRYEERRSTATIHDNDIVDNDIGIFVVTRSADQARIVQNNIVGNRSYNVKLGLDQSGDVTLPDNWWGTTDPAAITRTFFDHKYDSSLGSVFAPAPLEQPVVLPQAQSPEGG